MSLRTLLLQRSLPKHILQKSRLFYFAFELNLARRDLIRNAASQPNVSKRLRSQRIYRFHDIHAMAESKYEPSTSTDIPLTTAELEAAAATLQALERFEKDVMDETGMWVFGYGSLVWLQGFKFEKSLTGYIRGFARKFWQGNTAHRGTKEKPGRVATLIEEDDATVWGEAFLVKDKNAFSHLNNRECKLGGYITTITTFYPRQDGKDTKWIKPFPAILYIATPANELWLGDAPLVEIANNIVECSGNSGHNVEYLLKLANFFHENVPEAVDDHLFSLERIVLSEIEKRNLCLRTLMGEKKLKKSESESGAAADPDGEQDQGAAARGRTDTFQFTSTVPSKQLRCVNI